MQFNRVFLALALAMGLLALSSATAAPIIGPKADEGSDKWLADDAEVIMVFNFKAMTKSELMTKGVVADFVKKAMESEQAKAAMGAIGLDPMKDLDSMIFSGTTGLGGKDKAQRMVMRGNFDPEKLTAAMKKSDKVTASKEGGVDLFEIDAAPGQTLYGAFHGKGAFVLTESKEVTLGLAKKGPAKAGKKLKSMEHALKRFTGKESMALAVVITDEMKKAPMPAQAAKFVKALNSLTLSVTLSADLDVAIVGNTQDGEAKELAKLVTTMKGLADLWIEGQEGVPEPAKKLYKDISVENTRDTVTISLKIAKKTIEDLAKMAPPAKD